MSVTAEKRERAKQLLQEETFPELKSYWKAVAEGREREFWKQDLITWRNLPDNLPAEKVPPNSPPMLCKGAAIAGVFLKLRGAIRDGVITDQSVIRTIDTASRKGWNFEKPGAMTTREEINLLKGVLDKAISSIK